jgi:hypothetical protein
VLKARLKAIGERLFVLLFKTQDGVEILGSGIV